MNHLVGAAIAQAACHVGQLAPCPPGRYWNGYRCIPPRRFGLMPAHTGWGVVPGYHTQPEGKNICVQTEYRCCDSNGSPYPVDHYVFC
jgi:hypothetical protein